jgi:ABC-type antimicrobial peptide transport system permease subunit
MLWRSLSLNPTSRLVTIVRFKRDVPGTFDLSGVVHSIDPLLPVTGFRRLDQQVEIAYSAPQNGAIAGVIFGSLAIILAAAGLFATLSYNVSQRTREIGVRRALGASDPDILKLIASSTVALTLIGIGIAFVGIMLIPKKFSAILYGVSPQDPVLMLIAFAGFACIAAIASMGPAWKALRIEPVEALRID